MGSHIAYEFLTQNKGNIYFLVRIKDNVPGRYRLLQTLRFYFGDKFVNKNEDRIKTITGDITQNANLSLSKKDLSEVLKNISTVISCISIGKASSNVNNFKNLNIFGTENIINLCKRYGKRLVYISTVNVSGNLRKHELGFSNLTKKIFAENNLYIGQDLKSEYEITKFKSEVKVLDAIYDGLDAQILRTCNISNRYSDGSSCYNIKANDFAQKLKAYIDIGAFPKSILNCSFEITPVDFAAAAIVNILNHSSDCNVFHIMEPKKIPVSLFKETLIEAGINITPLSDRLMTDVTLGILSDDERKHIVSAILEDLDSNKKITYNSSVNLNWSFTENYLKNCGFRFKKLDKSYTLKSLNYFKKIGFIEV